MIMKSDINQIGDHKINELILFTDSHHSQYFLFIFKDNALLTLLNMASVNNLSDTADPKHQGLTFKSSVASPGDSYERASPDSEIFFRDFFAF